MNIYKFIIPLLFIIIVFSSCETDDDPIPEQFETSFAIEEIDDSGVNGEITFKKTDDNRTLITIMLEGTQTGGSHPVRIYRSTPDLDGPMVIELTPANGATGQSDTIVGALEDGTTTTYEDWVSFDGYVVIYESEINMDRLALGLLGGNIPNIPGG